jgi:hypothetical protein
MSQREVRDERQRRIGHLTSSFYCNSHPVLRGSNARSTSVVCAIWQYGQRDAKEAATAKIVVKPIRNNISVLMGSGGNIAVLPGKDGKLLIDSGFAVSRTGITNALAGISSDPNKRLINTHWHVDHTDGNEWL